MKNQIYIFILSLTFFSCTKEELMFSCDPEINAIVKSGVIEFSKIDLTEFLEYDIVLQKAIYRSFSADKKRDFWLEKLDSVVEIKEYNFEEIVHVERLVEHISNDYFAIELDSVEFLYRKEFEDDWKSYANDVLLWNQSEVFFIVNSLCITEKQYSQVIFDINEITLNTLRGTCTCSTESDYCSDTGGRCEEYGCSLTGKSNESDHPLTIQIDHP